MQYFQLKYDKTAPSGGVLNVLNYYKDNTKPITLTVTNASYMKLWINQTATGTDSDPEIPSKWLPYASTWTPNFSVEGDNYVHAIFMDEVGNKSEVVNSQVTVFDKTAPVVSNVVIENNKDVTTVQQVVVRVTASDATSGILKTVMSGNLAADSETEFTWTDTDRTNGYKDVVVKLSANTDPSHREAKIVYATAVDRSENESERKSDIIILYTGGVDPLIVLKDSTTGAVIGNHYGKSDFKIELQVLTGDASILKGYKVWGDFNTDGSITPTPEPSDWSDWGSGSTKTITGLKLTTLDGNKTVHGAARFTVGTLAGTVATKSALPDSASDGDVFKVTADESQGGKSTAYKYNGAESQFDFFGILETGDEFCYHELEIVTTHHSEAEPTIVLSTDKAVISDKEDHNIATLTSEFTTSCNLTEYKVVAYATQAAANAGTYEDASNVDLYGTTEKASGDTWEAELLESKLILACAGEGAKFLVVYAKNLCDKWGKSNVLSVSIDLTAPVGTVVVEQYYKEASGFASSATDAGSAVAKMRAWVDNSAGTEEPPVSSTEYNYAPNVTAAQVDWTNVVEGTNYLHILFTDEVGNSAVKHSNSFIYDTVAPVGASISAPALVNTTTIVATLSASDTTSGMGYYKIFGDVSGAATADQAEWKTYTTSVNVQLTNGDGTKTLKALFKDNAGNEIAAAVTCSVTLDTGSPTATIALYNNADTEVLGDYTNVVDFKAHIGGNDSISDITEYKIWGDITEAETEEEAEWKTFIPVTDKTYMSVAASLTTGDGLKSIHVKVKDKAGNPSQLATATVTLDTEPPVVDVNGVDYNTISKVHEPRLTVSGDEIANTYNDKMTFKFSSDTKLKSWKVCVNETGQQASTAVPIGTTGGSINMTGTNLAANTEVTCVIMGADYAATSKVNDQDGVYEVIIYGEDMAGNFSATHAI